MTIAVAKALEDGARLGRLRLDREHGRLRRRLRGAGGPVSGRPPARGAVASGKLAQARALGARLLEVRGSFDDALDSARELAGRGHARARELAEPAPSRGPEDRGLRDRGGARRRRPTCSRSPTAAAATRCAYAKGFAEWGAGEPRLLAVQSGDRAQTVASAIRIGEPVHAAGVAEAIERSGGSVVTVSDDEILAAWRSLAREEGVFCEPASAAALAGVEASELAAGTRVVCVITGHGLKDPETAARESPAATAVFADVTSIAEAAA